MATMTRRPIRVSDTIDESSPNPGQNPINYTYYQNANSLINGGTPYFCWGDSNVGIGPANGAKSRPVPITTDFLFDIPDNAKINNIKLNFRLKKTGDANFGNPNVELYCDGSIIGMARKILPTYDVNSYVNWEDLNLKGKDINKNNGLSIHFFMDANKNNDSNTYLEMLYFDLIVEYTEANIVLSININKSTFQPCEIITANYNVTDLGGVINDNVYLDVTPPPGLEIIRIDRSFTDGSYNENTGVWRVRLRGNVGAGLIIQYKLASTGSPGNKVFSLNLQGNPTSLKKAQITILPEVVSVSLALSSNAVSIPNELEILNHVEPTVYLNVTVKRNKNVDCVSPYDLPVNIPDCVIVSDPAMATELSTGYHHIMGEASSQGWINGIHQFTIPLQGAIVNDKCILKIGDEKTTVNVLPPQPPDTIPLYYAAFNLDPESYLVMENGASYIFSCYGKYIDDEIFEGTKNLRAVVINGNNSYISNPISTVDEWEELKVEFTYNDLYPVEVQLYGDYLPFGNGIPSFGDFCLMKSEYFMGYEYPALYLHNPRDLLNGNFTTTSLTFNPELGRMESTPHYLSSLDIYKSEWGENIILQGLGVSLRVENDQPVGVTVGMGTNEDDLFYHSSSDLTPGTNELLFGGAFDSWGFNFKDIPDKLKDILITLKLSDDSFTAEKKNVNVTNFQVIVYYSQVKNVGCGFSINDIHCKYLNFFWENWDNPEGQEWDVNLLKIDGGDGSTGTRANVKAKNLKVIGYFDVGEDNMKLLMSLKDKIIDYFTPKRDRLNKPIPKRIMFDHQADRFYPYILEDPIENEKIGDSYKFTVNLLIPDGCATAVKSAKNEAVGNIQTHQKVKPKVTVQLGYNPDDEPYEIEDAITGQRVTLLHKKNPDGTLHEDNILRQGLLVMIDCENLACFYKKEEQWQFLPFEYVSIDSMFFILHNQHDFLKNTLKCQVLEVEYDPKY